MLIAFIFAYKIKQNQPNISIAELLKPDSVFAYRMVSGF